MAATPDTCRLLSYRMCSSIHCVNRGAAKALPTAATSPSRHLTSSVSILTTTSSYSSSSTPRGTSAWLRSCRLSDICVAVISIVLLLSGPAVTAARDHHVKLCSEVQNQCYGRDGCKFALQNYFIYCTDLSEEPSTFRCTVQCKMALVMLLLSEEYLGANAFRDCNCEGEEFCLKQKERLAVCQDDVQTSLTAIQTPDITVSCSLATVACTADTSCLTAIDFYRNRCRRLLDSAHPRCTDRCNNSLKILYRQEKARKLRTCYCDGTEDYDCPLLKQSAHNLCSGVDIHTTTPRTRHHHNHTRSPPHPTPPPEYEIEYDDNTNCDQDPVDKEVLPHESLSHNSAYAVHSGGARSWWRQDLLLVSLVTVSLVLQLR